MKVIRRTLQAAAVTVFALAMCVLCTTLVLAACSEKVTLRFETNGGTRLESVEGTVGTSYTVPSDPEKEGYFFDGWYLNEDFSGERQSLPQSMPEKSTTYYAKYVKYPVLTLSAEGGTLEKSEHLVKPGTKLTEYLKSYVPQKRGLVFGGWLCGGRLIGEDDVMTSENMSLTARYRAEYAVDVYVQKADSPLEFERSEELSLTGADWEGEILAPEISVPEHFLLDEARAPVRSRVLRAGENVLSFYLLREEKEIRYFVTTPSGEKIQFAQDSRFGAKIPLKNCPLSEEGYLFFGWAQQENGPKEYDPEEIYTVGGTDAALYGTWAKTFPEAKGRGTLAVSEYVQDGKSEAVYQTGQSALEGVFERETEIFRTQTYSGRLDGRGGCMLDDSGTYSGYGLLLNRTDKSYGTLTLDFWNQKAVFEGEKTLSGDYEYLFEGETKGKYLFSCKDLEFLFALGEEEKIFLREGEEKGEYALTDGLSFSPFTKLSLDGFGKALLFRSGESFEGDYRGSGTGKDWNFSAQETDFRFMTVEESLKIGEQEVEKRRGYFVYDPALAGSYSGEGTLTLDGYGCRGEYKTAGGVLFAGRFTRDGAFLTLFGERTMKFTLQGTRFAPTGAEAGSYSGERGTLFLDGAGGATLAGKSKGGSYSRVGEDEYSYQSPEGSAFRFKTENGRYSVFRKELSGAYGGAYQTELCLDGYGGGTYRMLDGRVLPIKVGYCDDEICEIFSEEFSSPLYFRIKSSFKVSLIEAAEAGVYRVSENGKTTQTWLVLDGSGGAKLVGKETECGRYSLSASGEEAEVLFESGQKKFLLTRRGGERICVGYNSSASYSGGGTLRLDGYDFATYETGKEKIGGTYAIFEEGIELYAEESMILFELQGESILKTTKFLPYSGERGTLYLAEGSAILEGETRSVGSWKKGDVCVFEGEESMAFKIREQSYLLYDENSEAVYRLADGGTLSSDGCGYGSLVRGGVKITGKIVFRENLIELFSDRAVPTGVLAFERTPEGAVALGTEYGEYLGEEGSLFLDGKGGAVYLGVAGSYEADGEEFLFSGGGLTFRFRTGQREGTAVFERCFEVLSAREGTYETNLGALKVTSYEAILETEEGTRTFAILRAGEEYLLLRDESGEIFGFLFGSEEFDSPSYRMIAD